MAESQSTRRSPKLQDLTGQRFGRWTVLSFGPADKTGHTQWLCRCDCGTQKFVCAVALKSGASGTCGCRFRTQGGLGETKECRTWRSMLHRCYNPKQKESYPRYGKRGVVVCQRWRDSFAAFLEDMGLAPTSRHTIDRVDGKGSYTCGKCDECKQHGWPANCRWATSAEQNRNYSRNLLFTHDRETLVLKDWANRVGIQYGTLYCRVVSLGWSFADAITRPVRGHEATRQANAPYDQLISR